MIIPEESTVNVGVIERIERSASLRVYSDGVEELRARVDELVDAKQRTCSLAGECALRGTCNNFSEPGDGTSPYMGLFGSEPSIEGVDVTITDTQRNCPRPTAPQDIALVVEDENHCYI